VGFPHFATYCASKFALHGFSQALRRELVDSNIGITYIAPRAIATPMNDDRTNAMWQASGQAVDDPQQVADKIVRALQKNQQELFIGQPQSLFAWLNGLAPRLVNIGLKQQTALAKRFL
jgi:short-subunit dehydrogenase